jgi:hypothetical protein
MGQFDEFAASFAAPAAMSFAGDCGALELTTADGSKKEVYDAILGQIRTAEEVRGLTHAGGIAELDNVDTIQVSVIPKQSQTEINDSCQPRLKLTQDGDFEDWLIERIVSATPSMITLELRRPARKRGPEAFSQR